MLRIQDSNRGFALLDCLPGAFGFVIAKLKNIGMSQNFKGLLTSSVRKDDGQDKHCQYHERAYTRYVHQVTSVVFEGLRA